MMEKILPYLSIPSIIGVIVFIVRIISLARTSKIERMFMNDQKNLTIFIIQLFFASIFASILALNLTTLFYGDEEFEFYIAAFIIYFVFAFFAMPGLYNIINLFKKRTVHYIKINDSGSESNLYILRVTADDKVIVSNKPVASDKSAYKKLINKEELYNKEIYEEKL